MIKTWQLIRLIIRVKKECYAGSCVPGVTSSGFAGEEEGKVGFDEFMLPVGHLRKAPSKQEELGLGVP